jgi:hypothetical protein
MNEKIRQLAKCNERIQNFFETGPVQRAAIEEFAELIVRECAHLVDTLNEAYGAPSTAGKFIKDQFGVAE